MTGTLENPAIGELNEKGDPKIVELVKQYNGLLNSENKFPDTSLASPNNSVYRPLLFGGGVMGTTAEAGTYMLLGNGVSNRLSGVSLAASALVPSALYFAKADYEVAGKTQKLRLRAQVLTNATKPTITFTVGLYPMTFSGGTNELKVTLGTVVSGSTVAIVEPAASAATSGTGSDFTIPSDGYYMFGLVTNAGLTANNVSIVTAQLQSRSV